MSGTGVFDLAIVGGGINGAGIARDAAGRGLKVLLVEADDLARATSSANWGSRLAVRVIVLGEHPTKFAATRRLLPLANKATTRLVEQFRPAWRTV